MQIWALIVDSFREARDRKIFWVLIAISVLVAVAMSAVSFDDTGINLLFGLKTIAYDQFQMGGSMEPTQLRRAFAAGGAVNIMDSYMGLIGLSLAIVATAGIFPNFMERGAIDVVLAKPLPRWKLFVGKYIGSMAFVLVQATIFIVLTFLVIGLRWKTWLPGYLLGIPLLVIMFSYIYCVCALVGVMTRSTLTAILLSFAAWFVFFIPQAAYGIFQFVPEWKESKVFPVVKAVRWVLPKTADIAYIAARWTGANEAVDALPRQPPAGFDPEYDARVKRVQGLTEAQLSITAAKSIGSSLAFELLIVLWAMRRFCRLDF